MLNSGQFFVFLIYNMIVSFKQSWNFALETTSVAKPLWMLTVKSILFHDAFITALFYAKNIA